MIARLLFANTKRRKDLAQQGIAAELAGNLGKSTLRESQVFCKQLEGTRKKLSNADFVARAPKEVVEQQQQFVADLQQQIEVLEATIRDLKQD